MTMGNMSYCRFENTVADMRDCLEAMQDESFDFDALNEYEKLAIEEMECMIEDFQDMLINMLEGRGE